MKKNCPAVMTADESNISRIRSLLPGGCALTVGGFDGVHLGHRELLKTLSAISVCDGIPAVAVTFSENDRPKSAKSLAQEDKKLRLIAGCGADMIIRLPFSLVRDMPAERFAKAFIAETFGAKRFVCGYDFRFGAGRSGNAETLSLALSSYGTKVTVCDPVLYRGAPVSSTRIRAERTEGRVSEAARMLGARYSFTGTVEHGGGIAAGLGFPTANLRFPNELIPPARGVYAAEIVLRGKLYKGMVNFGVRPTFGGGDPLCEANVFGFSGDLYSEKIEILFADFIRPEKKFASAGELAVQMAKDRASAEKLFEERDIER